MLRKRIERTRQHPFEFFRLDNCAEAQRNDLAKVTQLLNQQDRKSLPLSTVYSHGCLVFRRQMAMFLMKASLSNKEKWLLCLQVSRLANLIRLGVCNIIRSVTTDRFN